VEHGARNVNIGSHTPSLRALLVRTQCVSARRDALEAAVLQFRSRHITSRRHDRKRAV